MKTIRCSQLGGPDSCPERFTAASFDEAAEMSRRHGMAMFEAQDKAHLEAMDRMRDQMNDPAAMEAWMNSKRQLFEDLPEE